MKTDRLTCLRCALCSHALARYEELLKSKSGQANSGTHQTMIITNLEAFGGRAQPVVKESVENRRAECQEVGMAAVS